MKVAIYVRVSTDKQECENQAIPLREFCKRSGYEIFKEYSDIISGKEKSRPAYDELFRDAHKRLFDMILFWDLSRFSRSGTQYTLNKLHELDLLNIAWKSYQEQYIDSVGPFKDIIISIMSTLAKIQREKISENTKAGLKHAKNVGKRGKDKKPRCRDGYFDRHQKIKNLAISPLISPNMKHYDSNTTILNTFCQTCGEANKDKLVLHHIIPRINNGADTIDNICVLCDNCHKSIHNGVKKDLSVSQLTKMGQAKSLNKVKIGKRGKDKKPRKRRGYFKRK
jgi:DNA invertase Pin-like site-specific DNA recombinase